MSSNNLLTNIKILKLSPILTEEETNKLEGHKIPSTHYKYIIDYDTDVYSIGENGSNETLLCKFRKNVIPHSKCVKVFKILQAHANKPNYNRGAAAGILDEKKLPKFIRTSKIIKRDRFRVFYKDADGVVKKSNIGNIAFSSILGYYDRPDRSKYRGKSIGTRKKMPLCRVTKFTESYPDEWKLIVDLIRVIDRQFKKLIPDRHKLQYDMASKTPDYQIANTAFSTITVNYNWQTAGHRDAGDFDAGFGNLIVLELDKCSTKDEIKKNNIVKYSGGATGFPRWGVAFDVRQGDFLAMDVHQLHCNTEIEAINNSSEINSVNHQPNFGRLSIVSYLRKKMAKCVSSGGRVA